MQSAFRICRGILPLLLLFFIVTVWGQEAEPDRKARAQWEHEYKHLLGVSAGFTFVPLGDQLEDTDARGLFAPNVGLDYLYRISRRFGIGFLGTIELDHYVVTDDQVERENALNLALVGIYSATRYLDFFVGGGMEIEQHDNLAVLRLGTQYALHVGQHWALVPKLYFDFKGNYNTWTLAVSFARKF